MSSETESRAGWCGDCERNDHTHHSATLGGICIGCACDVRATS